MQETLEGQERPKGHMDKELGEILDYFMKINIGKCFKDSGQRGH